jgi:hypothetical protein
MPVAPKNRLAPISEKVWHSLTKLSESFSTQSPPINLEEYAKDSGIQHVRFRQLISDAGLAKRGDKFEIIINTEAPGVSSPPETTASLGDGTWSKFQGSLRFTVAHEIAHAAFIHTAKVNDEGNLLEKHRADVEEACKILARLMLLPRRMLDQQIGKRLLDLNYLDELITAFRVSPEVFLRRLHLSDWNQEQGKLDGFVAFIQEKEGRLYFKAAHVFGRYATDRFHRALERVNPAASRKKYDYPNLSRVYRQVKWALEGFTVNDAKLDRKRDIESILRGEKENHLDIEVGWGEGEVIPCNLTFRRIHQKPLGILLSMKIAGPVQKPGQRTFF